MAPMYYAGEYPPRPGTTRGDDEEQSERRGTPYSTSGPGRLSSRSTGMRMEAREREREAASLQLGFEIIDRSGRTARTDRDHIAGSTATERTNKRAKPTMAVSGRTSGRGPRDRTVTTKEELIEQGFTDAQAAGVMLGRSHQYSAAQKPVHPSRQQLNSLNSMQQEGLGQEAGAFGSGPAAAAAAELAGLRATGVDLKQLLRLGFAPSILAASGYTVTELRGAGVTLSRANGFTPSQMHEAGATHKELRDAGFNALELYNDLHVSISELHAAGYAPSAMRASGFGPGQLQEAGYSPAEVRSAGFSPLALHNKAGYTLGMLRDAGYRCEELKVIDGVTPSRLLSAGFNKRQLSAIYTEAEIASSPAEIGTPGTPNTPGCAVSGFAGAAGALVHRSQTGLSPMAKPPARGKPDFYLPEHHRIKVGLEGLDADPPAKVVVGRSGRVYGSAVTCLYLKPSNLWRRLAIKALESAPFEPLILLTIAANVYTMAWESPLDAPGTDKAARILWWEHAFLGVYTLELAIKVVAMGFAFHRGAYLRDSWCQLDFLVVSLAWAPILFPSLPVGSIGAIRSVRVLRPLRALKKMPGMPMLVGSILNAIPKMRDVALLLGFIVVVFGIVGVELFKGALHHRCARSGFVETVGHPTVADEAMRRVRLLVGSSTGIDQSPYDTETTCRSSADCAAGETCAYFDANPENGLNSFDSIPMASVFLLQAITFDDWATTMYMLMGATSPASWVYCALITALGGFFVVNLFLAVIFEEFIVARRIQLAAEAAARANEPQLIFSEKGGGSYADRTPLKKMIERRGRTVADIEAELPMLQIDQTPAGTPSPLRIGPQTDRGRAHLLIAAAEDDTLGSVDYLLEKRRLTNFEKPCEVCGLAPLCRCIVFLHSGLHRLVTWSVFGHMATLLVVTNMLLMMLPHAGMSDDFAATIESSTETISYLFIGEMVLKIVGLGFTEYWTDGWNGLDGGITLISMLEMIAEKTDLLSNIPQLSFLRILRLLRVIRILRLMKSWKGLYKILSSFGRALPQMGNLFVLMLLVMIIFALLGMQVRHLPRSHAISPHLSPSMTFADHSPSLCHPILAVHRRHLHPRLWLLARAVRAWRVPGPIARREAPLPL